MWTDPEYTLKYARERQRDIVREVAAFRVRRAPAPALDEVAHTWVVALRMTARFVVAFRG